MPNTNPTGVVMPSVDGKVSSSALGRAVVADALRGVDPVGARGAEASTDWRHDYLVHFRRLVEAGLPSRDAALTIARDGLASLHERMRYRSGTDGAEEPLSAAFAVGGEPLRTVTIAGRGEAERELVVPYRGRQLAGRELDLQLERWVSAGIIERSCAQIVQTVAANPGWLALEGHRVVVLGAGAEMGPLRALLRWGADVVAVDLPRPAIWERLQGLAERYAGRLHVPVTGEERGADLLHDLGRVAAWIEGLDGRLVLGNYVYADGALNVRVAMAVDALTVRLRERRPDLGLAFLATPTDVFAVPEGAVDEANRRYAEATGIGRFRRPLRVLSAGRLLTRNYPPGLYPGVNDSLVPQQGPNYALAKRLQRWRAAEARAAGLPVSLAVAPATRTRSVVKNRLLAAAFAGAHRFGIEIFEPATSNTLMAALLVHDLNAARPAHEHPWQDEAFAAAHGGLWRQPYSARSALGIAVLMGIGGARG
ncbi:hypothetical protein ABT369_34985 [Dactylosporangium sp. NPDC000244]|uniref:hypothetical protein n=1 Tax=Dactylosporangium sp. NPDC000244 TaxID=3154365 RepID=UPI003327B5C3